MLSHRRAARADGGILEVSYVEGEKIPWNIRVQLLLASLPIAQVAIRNVKYHLFSKVVLEQDHQEILWWFRGTEILYIKTRNHITVLSCFLIFYSF